MSLVVLATFVTWLVSASTAQAQLMPDAQVGQAMFQSVAWADHSDQLMPDRLA
jgi:hypothetical protein